MDETKTEGWLLGRPWLQYVLVAALASVILFWRLGTAVMEDHECHLAITARTMAEDSGRNWIVPSDKKYDIPERTPLNRWLVPVENGEPRLVKTPLPYWSAALAALAAGRCDNWTCRFPAAFFALLASLATLAVGRRMLPPRAALLGAVILATSLGFQKWGRDARPEMTLCFFITAAMACFYLALDARGRLKHVLWMAAFWVLMGAANLAKEFVPLLLAWPLAAFVFFDRDLRDGGDPIALRRMRIFLAASGVGMAVHLLASNVPALQWWQHVNLGGHPMPEGKGIYLTMALCLGLPMLWYLVASRGHRPLLRLLPTALPGAAVMLAMFVPWMLYMGRLFPDVAGEVFSNQVTERAGGEGGWAVAPWYIYLGGLVTLTLPWVALLPGAFVAPLMKRFAQHRRPLVFLVLWCLGLVGLFTAAAAKREHYILPMLPAACLLMGFVAEDVFFRNAWITPAVAKLIGAGYGFAGIAGAVTMTVIAIVKKGDVMWVVLAAAAGVAAIPSVFTAVLALRRRLTPVPWLIAAAITIVYLVHWSFVDRFDDRKPICEFARQAAVMVGDAPVYHWSDPQSKTVFYFGRNVTPIEWLFMASGRDAADPQIGQRLVSYLGQDSSRAPWIIGYAGAAETLLPLGYQAVLTRQDIQPKHLLFTLYHREPKR